MPGRKQIAWVCVAALFLSGCSFVVQPIESYTSPDGFLRVEFPLEWQVYLSAEDEEFPGIALQVGLPEDLSQTQQPVVPPDAAMLALMVFPENEANLPPNFQLPTYDFVQFMSQQAGRSFSAPGESVPVSAPVPVEIGLGVETYQAIVEGSQAYVHVYGYPIAESTIVVAMLVVRPGGNAELQAQAEGIIRTLRLLVAPQTIAEHYFIE